MPTALRIGPYRITFYSYDGVELRHMHVDRENTSAKFWLDPDISLVANYGFRRKKSSESQASFERWLKRRQTA